MSSPSFNSQFCCPSSELCQHTSLPLTVNLHTPSLSYIHSPLTCQSLPATFDRPLASSLQTSLTINIAMNLPMWLPTLPSPPFFTQLTQWDYIYIRRIFAQGSTPKFILSCKYYICAYRPEYQRIKEPISSLTLWFHIRSCSHWRLPRSSANVCHTPGLAQARPHDAMVCLVIYYCKACKERQVM